MMKYDDYDPGSMAFFMRINYRDITSGRASTSWAAGQDRGLYLAASYQNILKNGTGGYLAWRSAF